MGTSKFLLLINVQLNITLNARIDINPKLVNDVMKLPS